MLGVATAGWRIAGVRTSQGEIAAPVVINAAGIWGDRIGRMVGVDVPISVCRHRINFFTRPKGADHPHPMVYDFVKNIYTRPEPGGLTLVGGLDSEEANDRVDPDRYNEGVTFEETAEAMERAMHRFPIMEGGRVARGYSGCFDVTPDWHPILDHSPVPASTSPRASRATASSSPVGDMVAPPGPRRQVAGRRRARVPALSLRRGQAHPRHLRRRADVLTGGGRGGGATDIVLFAGISGALPTARGRARRTPCGHPRGRGGSTIEVEAALRYR